jgi:predicted GNAT family N-acyltransferase
MRLKKAAVAKIRKIKAAETIPLRHAILRPGRPVETARMTGDDEKTTRHLGAFRDGKLVAVLSLFAREMPERPGKRGFQLRGMGTAPEARGMGLGKLLVAAAQKFAKKKHAEILWCNARVSAAEFYRKLGFEIIGEQFEIAEVGPHFRMVLRL